MRLATIRRDDEEVAAVVLPGSAVPVGEIRTPIGSGLPLDLISLLESERLHELWHWWNELSKTDAEVLSGRAIPSSEVSYGPLYRRSRKSWGIGLNYVGTPETWRRLLLRKNRRASSCVLTRPSSVQGRTSSMPEQSERVTGEAELGLVIGREAKDVSEEEAPSVVVGLATILDMTAEDILRENLRYLTRAKSFGPQLVTPDEVGEIEDLTVTTVSFHSKVMTLLPRSCTNRQRPDGPLLHHAG